ncbi:MAG: hypothetical protein QM761_09415 [Pseudoxanthomonas sp.]
MTSHSAVEKRLFWLLFFAQAKKSNPRASAERFTAFARLNFLMGN